MLIEAKAGERMDLKKLNFTKVAPLFEASFQVVPVLAHSNPESEVLTMKGCKSVNPLYAKPWLDR